MIKNLPIKYGWFILGGFVLGCILGFKSYITYAYWGETADFSWHKQAIPPIVNYTLWGFLVPIAYHLIKKFKVGSGFTVRQNTYGVLAGFGLAFFHEVVSNAIYFVPMHFFDILPFSKTVMNFIIGAFPSAFISRFIEYWIMYAIFSAFQFYKQYQQKELELIAVESKLTNAKLEALRFQLKPHFLFNTLNTISSLSEIDVKKTQAMVSKLGNLLRTLLDNDRRPKISLKEELDFIKSYLDIEQMRFHDRLTIDYEVDPQLLNAKVPSLILQPLVENAIKHGLASNSKESRIGIDIHLNGNEKIIMSVEDNGIGSEKAPREIMNSGIGLRNLNLRLKELYKGQFEMHIETTKANGFRVKMSIPYQS